MMRSYPVPDLRRDLGVTVAVLVVAIAAVLGGAIAVVVALAGIAGLMVRFAITVPHVVRLRHGRRSGHDSTPADQREDIT